MLRGGTPLTEGLHSIVLSVPIEKVWGFVSKIDKWAPLVPGYIMHELVNERTLLWEFKSDLGFIKKKIKLGIEIVEWDEPNKITFNIQGINEKFYGYGYFLAERLQIKETRMTGCIIINAKGVKAPVINGLLKSFVPQLTIEFAETIAQSLREQIK